LRPDGRRIQSPRKRGDVTSAQLGQGNVEEEMMHYLASIRRGKAQRVLSKGAASMKGVCASVNNARSEKHVQVKGKEDFRKYIKNH